MPGSVPSLETLTLIIRPLLSPPSPPYLSPQPLDAILRDGAAHEKHARTLIVAVLIQATIIPANIALESIFVELPLRIARPYFRPV